MSKWISVDKDLPLPNKRVLVCRVGKTSYQPFFAMRKNRPYEPWVYPNEDRCDIRITHWMPVPDLPK